MPKPEEQDEPLSYLLGELPDNSVDPLSAPSLREAGDELTAWADNEITPLTPKASVWEHIHSEIRAEKASPAIAFFPQRIWQIAALLLLALNLFWLILFLGEDASKRGDTIASAEQIASDSGLSTSFSPSQAPSNGTSSSPRTTEAQDTGAQNLETTLREREAQVNLLQRALADAQADAREADLDHQQLLSQLDSFFLPVEGKAQITLLSMAADRTPFTQADFDALLPASNPIVSSDALFLDSSTRFPAAIPEEELLPSPAAVAVWRNDLQEGIVNFYNIPELPEGATYQLWAEDSLTGETLNFGDLPSDSAGDFSITVTNDEDSTFSPSSLTVTINAGGGDSAVLIWGPGNPEAEPVDNFGSP